MAGGRVEAGRTTTVKLSDDRRSGVPVERGRQHGVQREDGAVVRGGEREVSAGVEQCRRGSQPRGEGGAGVDRIA
jgi:hypothetical protein